MSSGRSKDPRFGTEPTLPSESEEPARLPRPPGASRVDALSDEFLRFLSRRPHAIGDVIAARYRLTETLGNGAMGQVFVAENLSIGRRVAIKMLKPELLADASFRGRFQHEAQAIAVIEHRNVARFFDLVVGDPTFLVMEFVPGPTLAQLLKRGRIDVTRAINIGLRLCWALDAAHRAGVIHRDIKPSNVILAPDPENGEEPKLIDFGLAKLATATEGEGLTRTGQIVGTPQYMSPEQIANRPVDARSDVYSLGCVIYEMVTGAPAFSGSDDVQILYQQMHTDAERARARVPELPPELDALLAKAMAKAPGDRFASMQELAAALQVVERRRPPVSGVRERTREIARPRAAVGVGWALALGVAGAVAGGGGVWLGAQNAAAGGTILVTSRPSGASVELDGRPWRQTTPTALTAVAPGRHEVTLRADGHDALRQTVELDGSGRAAIDVALPGRTRAVEVQTIPAGALVFVDGQPGAHTPTTVKLAADDFHELRVELAGFETVTRAIKPEDKDALLSFNLEPETHDRGTVWVDGPPSTEVYVDGAPTGSWAPTVGLQIESGAHDLELHDSDGKLLVAKRVEVKRGDVLHVTLDPQLARK